MPFYGEISVFVSFAAYDKIGTFARAIFKGYMVSDVVIQKFQFFYAFVFAWLFCYVAISSSE